MERNLLFVCSANLNRSPAAEQIFKDSQVYKARSAGIFSLDNFVTQDLIDWSDIIFVMSEREEGHVTLLRNNFDLDGKEVFDLDVPDIYEKNDPELTRILREKLSRYLSDMP